MIYIVPLMVIPLVLFNIVAVIWGHDVWTATELISLTMVSGQTWAFSLGDLMIIIGIGCLFFEVLKSTGSSSRIITNHILSTVVFIVFLIEFIVVGVAANSVFFILLVLSLFDVVAGFYDHHQDGVPRRHLQPYGRAPRHSVSRGLTERCSGWLQSVDVSRFLNGFVRSSRP